MVTFLDYHKSLPFFLVPFVRFFLFLGLYRELHLSHADFQFYNQFINDFDDFLAVLLVIVGYEYSFRGLSLDFDF